MIKYPNKGTLLGTILTIPFELPPLTMYNFFGTICTIGGKRRFMKHYTVSELRKNIRQALELADQGEEIIISRWEKVYILKVPINPETYKVQSGRRVVLSDKKGKDTSAKADYQGSGLRDV
jgi:hypothetical protein